tara:strand:- start:396 stop:1055 length:660 start_codon:yes stop_codon:yes gene_type:complete
MINLKKNLFIEVLIFFSLILISLLIKIYFPNKVSSYLTMTLLALFILIFFSIIKKTKIALFLFIAIFLAGSHKEVQKKYFSFMSLMHWNDGLKIYMSVPYNFYKKNYSKAIKEFYLKDNGSNSGLNYIEDIFFILNKYKINELYVSEFFQKEIDQSVLFKERIREILYPSKIIKTEKNKVNNYKLEKNYYFKIYHKNEKYPVNCEILDQVNYVSIVRCN